MSRLASLDRAARHLGVSARTVRNYIGKGFFPAYRQPGIRGVLVDLDEVDRSMSRLPARKAYTGWGSFGPDAEIRTLPARKQAEVVTQGGDDQ